jgi:phospholipid/cholesterol/gamma-HCH transport system permease protein
MMFITSIGESAVGVFAAAARVTAYVLAVLGLAVRPSSWPRNVRDVLAHQIYFSGILALKLLAFLCVLMGVAVVAQVQGWLLAVGQSALLGSVLVNLVVRELGPLLVGFVLIGRSGTAICAELAGMRSRGEIHVLESQGVDPIAYLVMPRSISFAVSLFSLAVVFVSGTLLIGWLASAFSGMSDLGFSRFLGSILMATGPTDIVAFFAKTFLGGLIIGVICCDQGLHTGGLSTEIPQSVTKGVVYSMIALLAWSALVTLFKHL